MMNNILFPATLFFATIDTHMPSNDGILGAFEKHGLPGLLLLGAFGLVVWQEKSRRATATEDRKERQEYHQSLLEVIAKKDEEIKSQSDWIRSNFTAKFTSE